MDKRFPSRSRKLTSKAEAAKESDGLYQDRMSGEQRDTNRPDATLEEGSLPAGPAVARASKQDTGGIDLSLLHSMRDEQETGSRQGDREDDGATPRDTERRITRIAGQARNTNFDDPDPDLETPRNVDRPRMRRRDSYSDGNGSRGDPNGHEPSRISISEVQTLLTHLMQARPASKVDITRGDTPKWDRGKGGKFISFEQSFTMWMKMHEISHLLYNDPDLSDNREMKLHDQAKAVLFNQLPPSDQSTIYTDSVSLCEIWRYLVQKYHPSADADRTRLMLQWQRCVKGNRSVREYHTELLSLVSRLASLKRPLPDYFIRWKMLDCGPEFEHIRQVVEDNESLSYYEIMAKFIAFEERRNLRTPGSQNPAGGRGPGGRGKGLGNNKPGAGEHKGPDGDVLAVEGKKETRSCFNCGESGHIESDCPKLAANIRAHLKAMAARPRPAFKPKGKRPQ